LAELSKKYIRGRFVSGVFFFIKTVLVDLRFHVFHATYTQTTPTVPVIKREFHIIDDKTVKFLFFENLNHPAHRF